MKKMSSLDSWHSKFAAFLGVNKLKFNKLIIKLKIEQETNEKCYQEITNGRQKGLKD